MFTVKRTPVDVVLPTGCAVLNAGDPLVAQMAPLCAGSVIFFSIDGTNPTLQQHRGQGKRAAFVRDGQLILCEGPQETDLISINEVPLTLSGRVPFQVENVLAAASAAWALGLSKEAIRTSLETFRADRQDDPCRFNLLPHGEATLVIDDCHNISALAGSRVGPGPVSPSQSVPRSMQRVTPDATRTSFGRARSWPLPLTASSFSTTHQSPIGPRVMSRASCAGASSLPASLAGPREPSQGSHHRNHLMFLTTARRWARPWLCLHRASWAWFRPWTATSNRVLLCYAAIGVVGEEKSRAGAGTANKPHPRSVALPTIRSSSRPDSKKN
jgi:hypothetical protein